MKETRYPSDWRSVCFDDICYINKNSLSEKTPENYMFRYIDLSSVDKGVIKCTDQYIAFKDAPCRARRIIHKNDIIMSTVRPNLQGFAFIDFDPVDVICSTGFAVLTAKQQMCNKYIYQLLYSKEIETQINNMLVGSNYPAINSSDVASLKVCIPPFAEQKKIVEILGTWDRAIEELSDLIAEKKELKRGLMQRLLTGTQRLPGFTKPWKEIILGDVADFYNGYMFTSDSYIKNGTYRIITIANVQRGFLNYCETNTITKLPADIQEYQILSVGDIIFSMTGNVGRVCTVSIDNCLLNQRVGKIVEKGVHKTFLLHILSTDLFVQKMISLAQGGAQDNISFKDVKKYKFNAPSDTEEQKAIADVLSKADSEIDLLNQQLDVLREQKRGLMQKLLTGEIRVKVDNE